MHSFKVVRLGEKWGGVWEGKWGQEKFLEHGREDSMFVCR